MRIGIDARELAGRVTGVGRALRALISEWAQFPTAEPHDFLLYAPEPLAIPLDSPRFRTRVIAGATGTWWEQIYLPRAANADRLDVFFAPAYTAPLRIAVPTVATIYDLSYLARPDWFRLREGVRRRWLTEQTARRARAVITASEFSRREIVDRLGVPAERVRVILLGIDHLHVPRQTTADPRVLFVGSIFNRRHVPDLISAIAGLTGRHPTVSLDIVGDNRTFPYEDVEGAIANLGLGERVRWHRYVTDELLLTLYGRARAFAFLSEYEGLGMTPLEALGAGVPPVLLDTAIARESCGDAALYVLLGDQKGTERALERVLFDDDTRSAILAAAPAVLAKYDWARAARETLAVLEAAGSSD